MTTVDVEQLRGQFTGVGEVAVVDEGDAVRRIDIERLRLLLVGGVTLGGLTHVSEAHVAGQVAHVPRAIRLANLAAGFLHVQGVALCCGDSGGVLSAMLQQQQGVIDLLVDRLG